MKHLILLLSAFVLFVGCAKNRDTEKERLKDTELRLPKAQLMGKSSVRDLYYAKVTVVKNSLDGGFVFSGLQSDMRVGYFDFTRDFVVFRSYMGPFAGRETAAAKDPDLFSWPVTYHQPGLNEVDGKVTNKEFDDDRIPWDQKNYFIADWGKPNITEENTLVGKDECWTVASRRRVDDSVVMEDGYFGYIVEVVYNRECPTSYETVYNGFTTYTVQYHYSFRRWNQTDYQPMAYEGELDPNRRKFGYFTSIKEELDANGRPKNWFFVNRWDPRKQHDFYFTENTTDEFKFLIKDVFAKTNKIFADMGYGKEVFRILENTAGDGKVKKLGDLRYSFVNIVEHIDPSAPLGYGPSDADPYTGEIISASLNIWSASLKDYIRRIQISADRMPTKFSSSLYTKMVEVLKESPDQWSTKWDTTDKRLEFFRHMARETNYSHPYYNSFAKTAGPVPVEMVVDRPTPNGKKGNYVQPKVVGYDKVSNQVEWVNVLFSSFAAAETSGYSDLSVLAYTPIEESPLFKKLAVLSKNASSMPSEAMMKQFTQTVSQREEEMKADISRNIRGHCRMDMAEALAGSEELIISGFTPQQIAENIIYRTAIHEFGHNLNLRHNFYGTVDEANFPPQSIVMSEQTANGVVPMLNPDGSQKMWPAVSSSVMDYLRLQDDFFTEQNWEPYDVAAIKYAYSGGTIDDGKLYLFCTDENSATSALCNKFDRGSTPTQIVMSLIDAYEDGYYTRNYRDGRAYWNTNGYASGILATMQGMKEFLPMWRAGFYESGLRTELGKLGYGKDDTEAMITETNREIKKSLKMILAFYQAVLQQSNSDKPFRSEYDLGTGALQRMGIGFDKQAAMYFMGGDDALFYNPNRILYNNSFMTYMYDEDLAVIMENILENIVTQRVDMEPWFISYGRQLYAKSAMDYSNRDDQSMIAKIRVKRYNADDLKLYFGVDLNDPKFESPAVIITPVVSKDVDFKSGDQLAVVRSNSYYYVFSKQQNAYAYDIFRDIKFAEETDSSVTQPLLDLQELYSIYYYYTTGNVE